MSERPGTSFTRAFGEAVADIRMKVVEEPWFGRAVSEPPRTVDIFAPGEVAPAEAAAETLSAEPVASGIEAPAIGVSPPDADLEPEL